MASVASLIVRIGAQDTEISAALDKLIGNARRADADLSKLGDSPIAQKAIADTAKLAATIKEITDAQQKFADKAVNAAVGVGTLGGASKLMSGQLDEVARTLNKGMDAFRALGQQAPEDLRLVSDAVNRQRDAVKGLADSGETIGSAFSGIKSMLAQAFSVGAIVAFGNKVLEAGDQIQKMADQTGLSTDEVQKFQYIAGQTGTSVESLIGAVQNLQQRLGDENSGAAGAFAKLGINAEAFNKLDTYQQMTTLGDAIKAIKDPTEQASVAAALFGKTWKEILPAIKGGMSELGEQAAIMSESTVKSLDRIGDSMKALKQNAIVAGGGVIVALEGMGFAVGDFLSKFNPEHFGVATSQILKLQVALNDPTGVDTFKSALASIKPVTLDVGAGVKTMGASFADVGVAELDLTQKANKLIDAHKAAAAETKRFAESMENAFGGLITINGAVETSFQDLSYKVDTYTTAQDLATESARKYLKGSRDEIQVAADQWDNLASSILQTSNALTSLSDVAKNFKLPNITLPNIVPQNSSLIQAAGKTLGDQFGSGIADSLNKIPDLMVKAFTGGGGLKGAMSALVSDIGADLGKALTGVFKDGKVVGGLASGMTGTFAKAFAAAGPAIGALAGTLIDGLAYASQAARST